MARRGQSLMVCPGCAKKGVSLRLGGEDWFTCRYCQWTTAADGYDDQDLKGRQALRQANPGHPDIPMSEPDWVSIPR